MRNLILFITLFAFFIANGQEKSSTGYELNWTKPVKVERDSMLNGKHKLPAFAFEVFESDAKMAVDEWVAAYEEQGGKVTGTDPYKSTAVKVDGLSGEVIVMAKVARNRKDGLARVLVALAANDSTAAPDEAKGEKAVYDLAVRMNKGVVQKQLDEQQKLVDDLTRDLESAQQDQAKAHSKSADANDDLEDAKRKKARLSSKQSDLQADQAKYEARYAKSNDPKDLKKLTKARNDLVKVHRDMAKQMKREADAQKKANKRHADIPDAVEDQQELQAKKEKAVSDLEALKRKKEAVK